MAAPATTGQLRTSITDMQIGDYIACRYQSTNALAYFSELGGCTMAEIPTAGSATPDGLFYFIKVDKGLLVADRITLHTITWDSLNASKLIQGLPDQLPFYENLLQITNNETGLPQPELAVLDSQLAYNGGISSNAGFTLEYTTPINGKYVVVSFNGTSTLSQGQILVEYHNGTTWVVAKNITGLAQIANKDKHKPLIFTLDSTFVSNKFRVKVLQSDGVALVKIEHVAIIEKIIIGSYRSLTGGVAYADANGGSTTTVGNSYLYGCFPANNEYDKYLVNFPNDKIQASKTLDDIWHGLSANSWTQDTNMLAIAASTNRMLRGGYSGNPIQSAVYGTSSNSAVWFGFRPVLEYREGV